MTDQDSQVSKPESTLCPTCGTKTTENATRCVVCGTELGKGSAVRPGKTRAQITLSLPIAILLLIVFTLLAAGLTYGAMQLVPEEVEKLIKKFKGIERIKSIFNDAN